MVADWASTLIAVRGRWHSVGSLENTPMPVNLPPFWLRAATAVTQALLPSRCLLCGESAKRVDLCEACCRALIGNAPACAQCALPLPSAEAACGACLRDPPPFSQTFAVWRYAAPIAQLLPRFKFHHDLAAGRVLAELALPILRQWPGWQGVDRMIPVPLHSSRLAQRGYNQALEWAKPLARALPLRLDHAGLRRIRATAAQTELDAVARRRNLRGAFEASPLHGEVVVLVDDVVTTGATVREATRSLLRAGAREVRVLAIARAPEPTQR